MNKSKSITRHTFSAVTLTALLLATSALGDAATTQPNPVSAPTVIYIIRHAEKPVDKTDPNITAKGRERAEALVQGFPQRFGKPDFIFATAKSKSSDRPLETVTPLAKSLGEDVNNSFTVAQVDDLAKELLTSPRYAGRTVLVCWHHGEIPNLARKLGATDVPDKWPDDHFDRVWELKFTPNGVMFRDLPEHALTGDSD